MKVGDLLEIECSNDTLEEINLTAQLFCQVMSLEAKGEKETIPPREENIEVSWPFINQSIAILDTDF